MIRQNIIANIIARVWGVVSAYCFVPLYLKFLGIEAYGLVGFYSTSLGVLAFAHMGLTVTLALSWLGWVHLICNLIPL